MFTKKNGHKKVKLAKTPNLGLLLGIGFIIFIILLFSVFIGRHLERTHYPKINKLETAILDITISHLQIEEGNILLDNKLNNPHILEAKSLINSLLTSSWGDYFLPLAKNKQQKEVKIILRKLNEFEVLLKSYQYTSGSKIKHDAAFFSLVIRVEKLQESLQSVYLKQINTLHKIQWLNLLLFVIYMVFVYYIVKRYNHLRKTFIKTQEDRLNEKKITHYFLQESQNLSKLGYYTYDFKDSRWKASKTIIDILGLKKQEGFLKAWIALIHPEDRHILTDVLNKRKKDATIPLNVTYRLIRPKDEKVLWIHHLAQDIKLDSNGNKRPVLGVIQDITFHKEVVNSLVLRGKELVSVVESLDDVLFFITVEPNGKYIFKNVNTAFLRATGLKEEQVIGKTIEQVIPEPLLDKVLRNCQTAINKKDVVKWEGKSPFNSSFKVGIIGISPIFDKTGVCTHLVGSVHDITERKHAEDALRAKEELYRSVFENAPLGIFHFNVDGIITETNQELIKILGSTRKKLIGLNMLKEFKDKKMLKAIKETLEFGTGYYEDNYTSVTGSKTVPLVIHFKAIYDIDKKVIGGVGLVEDITERYELHRSLVKSKKDLLKSQKIAQLGTYNLNLKTQKFKSSAIFDALVGLKPTDAKTFANWRTITHPDDTPDNQKMLTHCIKTGAKFKREYRIIKEDTKEVRWLYGLGEIIFKDNVATNFIGTIQDITERKKIEEDLKISENKFRELYEKSGDAILIIKNGDFVDCNQATVKMLGYKSKEAFLNVHPSKLSPKVQSDGQDSFIKAEKNLKTCLEKGTYRFEWLHMRSNREVFYVEVLLTTISKEPDNNVIHCVWRDITERKEAELALKQSEHKLREAQEITRLGTFIFDDSTDLFETSAICDDIMGLDASYKRDIKGWINLVFPEDYNKVQPLFDDNTIEIITGEYRIVRPIDNKIVWILGKAKKEYDSKGSRTLITGTVQDITKRKESEEKLRQSDAILNRINSLVLVANRKGDITYASPSVKTILGYEPDDLLGQGWWQLTFTDLKLLNKIKKTISNYYFSKTPLPVMTNLRKIKTKEGIYKYIEWFVSKGGNNATIAIGIDVTKRQHEANVKEVIHKISKFANGTPNLDILLPYVRNTLHTVIDTTNFFIALYDDKKDSFNVLFRIDEEDISRDDYLQYFKKGKTLSGYVLDTQTPLLSTISTARKLYKEGVIKEGGVKSKCWLGTPLLIENKAIGVMVVQSYTNAKAFSKDDMALLDLIASNISLVIKKSKDYERIRLLNQALIQSPESVVVTNKDGEIEYVNPAFTKLSGYTEEEALGQNPRLLKSGDQPKSYYKNLWETINKGKIWEGEFVNKHKDGKKYLVAATISAVVNREGEIINFIGVEEDITEKRKLERDFIHAFIDAQELEKQSFGEELHDGISQILAAESMFIQVVINQNKDILDAKSLGYLENVKKLNLRAIDEARNISHGLMSKQLKEKGLLEAVENICIDYSQTKDIIFNFRTENLEEDEINNEIKTNFFRLIQEISTNTVRHSLAKTAHISLTKTPNNKLLLVISDDGIGIDFEKMKAEKRGAGLKNIERRIKLLNGNYKLESEPNKGVKYTIEVPLESIQ